MSVLKVNEIHMNIPRSMLKKDGNKRGDKEKDAVITTLLIIAAFIISYFCYYFSLFGYLFANSFQVSRFVPCLFVNHRIN